jgi:hypothetical protein
MNARWDIVMSSLTRLVCGKNDEELVLISDISFRLVGAGNAAKLHVWALYQRLVELLRRFSSSA